MEQSLVGRFIGLLFFERTVAHAEHLPTRSANDHEALKFFYENIVKLADRYAEAYQGKYGPIFDIVVTQKKEPNESFSQFLLSNIIWIEATRETYSPNPDSFLLAITDDIIELHYTTIDKLNRT